MGLYDRDYTQDNYREQSRYAPQMQSGFSHITKAVKWLLIINFAIFFAGVFFFPPVKGETAVKYPITFFEKWFSVFPISTAYMLQLWRIFSYQFLHADIWHILFNMLALYFLGPALERLWGTRRFLIFYLVCGAAGGLFYTFLVGINFLEAGPMVGASGSILGLLAACAILFPQFIILVLFFPVPIRVAAVGFTIAFLFIVINKGENAGGEAAHLAGMAAGAAYVLSGPVLSRLKFRIRSARWRRKMASREKLMMEADRILQKVHESGINSLTRREKKILKEATESEQVKDGF